MPSSTSSSERAPALRWGRTWGIALVLFFGFFGWLEYAARARDIEPAFTDSAWLWSYWRAEVSDHDPKTVALVGSSRFQFGIDPAVMEEALPGHDVVQLAIVSSSPLPVLHDLAQDPSFVGTAVVEVHPWIWFTDQPKWLATVEDYVAASRVRAWSENLEAPMRMFVMSRLVSMRNEFRPTKALFSAIKKGEFPDTGYKRLRADRFREVDYSKIDVEAMLAAKRKNGPNLTPAFTPERLAERLEKVTADVEAIEERGGRVVFFHMITSGENRDGEEEKFPRARYWAELEEAFGDRAVHFADVPAFDGFTCADGSHLTVADTPAFARAFSEHVVAPVLD